MCEPAHSIVQYQDHSDLDDNLPFSGQMSLEQRLRAGLGEKVMSWKKKIGQWFHFSRLGSGHHAATKLYGLKERYLPRETRYEGFWWNRTFRLDGAFHGVLMDREAAWQAAKDYHDSVVMSSMSQFRRFLELSIEKSDRATGYVNHFIDDVLNPRGRDLLLKKFKRIFGFRKGVYDLFGLFVAPEEKARATKVVMGFTRRRELFLPHWADDDRLWTPGR